MSAPTQRPHGGILGLGDPAEWNWSYITARVEAFGRYELHPVALRYRAAAAALAREHGLALQVLGPDVIRLLPLESSAAIGAAVGPREALKK